MRLQTLCFIGAFAVTAIPLSAGAQSLPANDQWTTNAQNEVNRVVGSSRSWRDGHHLAFAYT